MALSGSFTGGFSGTGGAYVQVDWSGSQNIPSNYTDVTMNVYFVKTSSYSWNLYGGPPNGAYRNFNINGNNEGAYFSFDLRSVTVQHIGGRTVQVAHNADGTKSCYIGTDGSTNTGFGNWGFSQTVTLDTIPRAAYITNGNIDFTIGNSIPINLYNPGNFYAQALTYVNNVLIKTQNLGQVSSATLTFNSGEIDTMYAQVPNATSINTNTFVRIRTYTDSGYTAQIGGNQDKAMTASVDQTANKPTFSTYSLANVDKNIPVVDAYGETVVTSSTATLLGASTKMIKGYSKVKATVAAANKMVALNQATPVKYRFSTALQAIEAAYSASLDVELELDNVSSNSFTVAAYDSRNLNTAVAGSLSVMADYTALSLFNMTLARDNAVDPITTLTFEGQFWKKYFGSNDPSTVQGVLNAITTHYRFKNSANDWTTQNGTFTVTIASPAVVTKSTHGLSTGDVVYLTTTGALPTGLSVNTKYYVIVTGSNTFNLASSSANAEAGTAINTSGSQSGTHTLHIGSPWTSITASSDSSGAISYSAAIDGDLGASGFDQDKSFTVQVRVYDKLSVQIVEQTLSVGTPLIHKTKQGVAFKGRYDAAEGGDLQILDSFLGIERNIIDLLAEYKNDMLINGNMNIWQRYGSSKSIGASALFACDRWEAFRASFATGMTVSRQDALAVPGSIYCARVQRDSGNSGTGSLQFCEALESANSFRARGQYLTLSFWARKGSNYSPTSSLLRVRINSGTGSNQRVSSGFTGINTELEEYVTLTTSWQKFVVTTPAVVGSSVSQLAVQFIMEPTGTASTNDYFEVTQAKLAIGKDAMVYIPKSFEQDWWECQRFFCQSFEYGTVAADNLGRSGAVHRNANNTNHSYLSFGTVFFPREMFRTPTVTFYNPEGVNSNKCRNLNANTNHPLANPTVTRRSFYTFVDTSAIGSEHQICFHFTADGEFT